MSSFRSTGACTQLAYRSEIEFNKVSTAILQTKGMLRPVTGDSSSQTRNLSPIFDLHRFQKQLIGFLPCCDISNETSVIYISNKDGNRYSSVGMVSGCGLDGRGSIPGRSKRFSPFRSVEAGSEAHPASYRMGSRGLILGD